MVDADVDADAVVVVAVVVAVAVAAVDPDRCAKWCRLDTSADQTLVHIVLEN
jgi:hypothetical protein